MGTIKKYYLFIFLSLFINFNPLHALSLKKVAEHFCAQLFGKTPASVEIQDKINNARKAFHLKTTPQSPINYIENKWLQGLSAFTWFGTWINKDAWNIMTEEEKVFCAYHEIAHEAKKHPLKQISIATSTLLASIYAATKYAPRLSRQLINSSNNITHYSLSLFLGMGAITAIAGIFIPYIARECEKEADIAAAQKLCGEKKKRIVQHHIDLLKKEKGDKSNMCDMWNIWFKSTTEQINYLQPLLEKYTPHHE